MKHIFHITFKKMFTRAVLHALVSELSHLVFE